MNERIRELVRQAVVAVDIVTGNEALDDELAKMYIPDCFSEKLAELIVKECANIDFRRKVGLTADDHYEISKVIKQHFGVEE